MGKHIHIHLHRAVAKDSTAEQEANALKQKMDAIELQFNASKDPKERKSLMKKYAELQEQRETMLVYPSRFR